MRLVWTFFALFGEGEVVWGFGRESPKSCSEDLGFNVSHEETICLECAVLGITPRTQLYSGTLQAAPGDADGWDQEVLGIEPVSTMCKQMPSPPKLVFALGPNFLI